MKLISIVLISIVLFSCSSEKPRGKTAAEVLYKEALEFVKDDRFLLATERLNLLRSQHPYSFYATHAELLQADILFLQENYVEAAAAYLMFRDFHPKHKKLAYVIWKIGDSYFNQLPRTYDRDLSAAYEAKKFFKELINRYPQDQHAAEAREKIAKSNKMLQDKSLYIANFYYKTKVFDAARYRYLNILSEHKEKEIQEKVKLKIVSSSMKLKDYEQCIRYSDLYKKNLSEKFHSELDKMRINCTEKMRKNLTN